ncbi:MAG: hypothetical protein LUI13_06870 [Lachnospiraceae bacterium]|nr:hypothetical protein [Lachnospiraceae bacterium]
MRKWLDDQNATYMWEEFHSLEEDTVDVLFMGTSHVHEGIDPMYIYENSGITSFTLSGSQARFDTTYLALKEALKTQSPQILFLDMSAIQYGQQLREAKIHQITDHISLPLDKIELVRNSEDEDLTMLDVLFPLFRFHSRWNQLNAHDFMYATGDLETTYTRGHYVDYTTVLSEFHFYDEDGMTCRITDRDRSYLDRLVTLCEENDIELIMYKLPAPYWSLSLSESATEIAAEYGLEFWEMYYEFDEIGLDVTTDFRDATDHLNQYGAEKISAYLMEYLQENYDLEDQRGTNARWDSDLAGYHQELEDAYQTLLEAETEPEDGTDIDNQDDEEEDDEAVDHLVQDADEEEGE